jgi:hypothetical protein
MGLISSRADLGSIQVGQVEFKDYFQLRPRGSEGQTKPGSVCHATGLILNDGTGALAESSLIPQ